MGIIPCAIEYILVAYLFYTQQFIPLNTIPLICLSTLLFPFGNHKFPFPFFLNLWVCFCFGYTFLYVFFFLVPHISDITQYLSLTYFTKHNILYVHPHCRKWQNFILFNGWVTCQCVCVCVCVCVPIHKGIAIVNNAAMNTGVCVSFQINVFTFPGYIPKE